MNAQSITKPLDPVYFDNVAQAWRHYDETWVESYGPFDTREDAEEHLKRYMKERLGE